MFSYFENRQTTYFDVFCLNFSIETKIKTLFLISYCNLSRKRNSTLGTRRTVKNHFCWRTEKTELIPAIYISFYPTICNTITKIFIVITKMLSKCQQTNHIWRLYFLEDEKHSMILLWIELSLKLFVLVRKFMINFELILTLHSFTYKWFM